jgi:hypothetical protein
VNGFPHMGTLIIKRWHITWIVFLNWKANKLSTYISPKNPQTR